MTATEGAVGRVGWAAWRASYEVHLGAAMIYFIRASDSGNIKIGYSANPDIRRLSLQTGNEQRLELIGTIFGGKKEEKSLHSRFEHLRVNGEWYRGDDELLRYIGTVIHVDGLQVIVPFSASGKRRKLVRCDSLRCVLMLESFSRDSFEPASIVWGICFGDHGYEQILRLFHDGCDCFDL